MGSKLARSRQVTSSSQNLHVRRIALIYSRIKRSCVKMEDFLKAEQRGIEFYKE